MYIPIFLNIRAVDDSGHLTTEFQIYEDTLNQSMRNALSDDGWTIPQLTPAQIIAILPQMPDGTIAYDTTADVFVGRANGATVKFTTTAWP